jgi:hypothetical protein
MQSNNFHQETDRDHEAPQPDPTPRIAETTGPSAAAPAAIAARIVMQALHTQFEEH